MLTLLYKSAAKDLGFQRGIALITQYFTPKNNSVLQGLYTYVYMYAYMYVHRYISSSMCIYS
jgi:hypothetical protein